MSGGRFDYLQYNMARVADSIESILTASFEYSYLTTLRLEQTVKALREASIMLNRADWLISGDDGEDTFNERWNEDFKKLRECEGE